MITPEIKDSSNRCLNFSFPLSQPWPTCWPTKVSLLRIFSRIISSIWRWSLTMDGKCCPRVMMLPTGLIFGPFLLRLRAWPKFIARLRLALAVVERRRRRSLLINKGFSKRLLMICIVCIRQASTTPFSRYCTYVKSLNLVSLISTKMYIIGSYANWWHIGGHSPHAREADDPGKGLSCWRC